MSDDQPVDMDDVQGLIIRGYNFQSIRYVIFKIEGSAKPGDACTQGARDFCAALLPGGSGPLSITSASPWPGGIKPDYCLNIGLTYDGLARLIGDANCSTVGNASYDLFNLYQAGAADENNVQAIGDTDASAPEYWWKRSGGWQLDEPPTADGSELHLQLTIYAHDPESREAYYGKLLAMIPKVSGKPSLIPAFYKDSDPIKVGEDLDYIHFGYKDSLSQPRIGNTLWNKPKIRLLNGISTVDDRPVVPAYSFVIATTTPIYNAHPLLVNGTFAAFRLLYQDVGEFKKFISSDKTVAPELVAAKMCGRWFDGTPLVVSPDGEDKKLKDFDYTNFNYHTPTPNQQGPRVADDAGALCPYAAHIRRANPRDDGNVKGNEPVNGKPAYADIHRVLRRASPYGPPYHEDEPFTVQRGLVGLFIGANLNDQFQFIMGQWISSGGFRNPDKSPNTSGIDPLFGPQLSDGDPDDHKFAYNTGKGVYKELPGLTRFIRTDGSLYLFLPGIAGLKYISEGKIPPG